jgi:hypothetical protein
MKLGQEALAQYTELVAALQQLHAEWIVTEVEEIIARGKVVSFRDLSQEESALYESRVVEESGRGVAVPRAKPSDIIGVPYDPHERLGLLVQAIERVVAVSELSRSYIYRFAVTRGIGSIELWNPLEDDQMADSRDVHIVSVQSPTFTNERLAILRHVLSSEVLG